MVKEECKDRVPGPVQRVLKSFHTEVREFIVFHLCNTTLINSVPCSLSLGKSNFNFNFKLSPDTLQCRWFYMLVAAILIASEFRRCMLRHIWWFSSNYSNDSVPWHSDSIHKSDWLNKLAIDDFNCRSWHTWRLLAIAGEFYRRYLTCQILAILFAGCGDQNRTSWRFSLIAVTSV